MTGLPSCSLIMDRGEEGRLFFYKMVSDGKQERRDLCIFVTTIMKRGKI